MDDLELLMASCGPPKPPNPVRPKLSKPSASYVPARKATRPSRPVILIPAKSMDPSVKQIQVLPPVSSTPSHSEQMNKWRPKPKPSKPTVKKPVAHKPKPVPEFNRKSDLSRPSSKARYSLPPMKAPPRLHPRQRSMTPPRCSTPPPDVPRSPPRNLFSKNARFSPEPEERYVTYSPPRRPLIAVDPEYLRYLQHMEIEAQRSRPYSRPPLTPAQRRRMRRTAPYRHRPKYNL